MILTMKMIMVIMIMMMIKMNGMNTIILIEITKKLISSILIIMIGEMIRNFFINEDHT